jgi:VanZ family protein
MKLKFSDLLRNSFFWFILFSVWFYALWKLSSGPLVLKFGSTIPHFDKLCHFTYFLGSGFFTSAFFYFINSKKSHWDQVLSFSILITVFAGCLDEHHQSFVLGRSGNDAKDLTADILGGLIGYWIFKKIVAWMKLN